MKKIISVLAIAFVAFGGSLLHAPTVAANGWATAGKILAGVAGADLIFNGSNSMAGRTVAGVGNIFTGGYYSRQQPCGYGYAQPAPVVYGYSQPAPRRCWEEVRRIPGYDSYGNFLGYFDKRVSVCSDY
jgi:hypothetical protein